MDFELRAAKEKWEKEQREKKERARAHIEREKKARDEAAKRQEAIETAQRLRRLEESAALDAARQQEEQDLEYGDGVVFNRVFQAVSVPGDGDKIRLPASAFNELAGQGALDKGPMFFEISSISQPGSVSSGNIADMENEEVSLGRQEPQSTHAGVLEFTAVEGSVELPPHVWRNVGFINSQGVFNSLEGGTWMVRVRYVRLPKGTYAKLQPEDADFADVLNHKAVLETKLRQHASLSQGDLLLVNHGGYDYGLRVLELRPQSSVSVLETDLEVDITATVDGGLSAQGRLTPLLLGKPEAGVVEEGEYKYFRFTIDPKLEKEVSTGDVEILVTLDVDNQAGKGADADLYVSAHPVLFPTQHQHQWSSHDMGSKVICMTDLEKLNQSPEGISAKTLSAGSYSVGVYGFRGVTKFKLGVEAKPTVQKPSQGQRVGAGSQGLESSIGTSSNIRQPDDGFLKCDNCKQLVPARTIVLHEAYCRRHNVACQHPGCGVVLRKEEMGKHEHCSKCGQGFTHEELGKHMKVFHEPLKCTCGVVLEMEEMVKHRATSCPHRMVTCQFCGDMVQAGAEAEDVRDKFRGLTQHESECGARTATCDTCGRAIMLKEMDLHRAAAHGGGHTLMKDGSATQDLHGGISGWSMPSGLPESPVPERNWGGSLLTDQAASQVAGLTVNPRVNEAASNVQIQCPICGIEFDGADRERQLDAHLDNKHFMTQASTEMDIDDVATSPAIPERTTHRSLSVSCPICGMAVHSERDLSSHIDLVH